MTKDELIALAKEAGFVPNYGIAPLPIMDYATVGLDPTLERFATLVAAKERDAEMSFDNLFDGSNAHLLEEAMSNAELIERLNEPERHYPGNFDTVKRANALLMCLCQEAADVLAAQEKQIAELTELAEKMSIAAMEERHRRMEVSRDLRIARDAMTKAAALECNGVIRVALAQIGGEDAGD